MSHATQVSDSYAKYLASLTSQISSVNNASGMYHARELEAVSRTSSLTGELAQVNSKILSVNSRISKLEAFKQSTLDAFAMRTDVLNQSIAKSSKIIQLIVLLQAKMAVRTVTTE